MYESELAYDELYIDKHYFGTTLRLSFGSRHPYLFLSIIVGSTCIPT